MDPDPELDVTLSNGQELVTFQIAAVEGPREAWAIQEPWAPLRVVVDRAEALATRARLDRLIAERLETRWVPVDRDTVAPRVTPTPLPPDLALHISSLLEALEAGRAALRAADPTGQLWAACMILVRQARRCGVAAARPRRLRAQRERRLAELAEEAGDMRAAILHYRAALAASPRIGVQRRLAALTAVWSSPTDRHPDRPGAADVRTGRDGTDPVRPRMPVHASLTRRMHPNTGHPHHPRGCGPQAPEDTTMAKKSTEKIQLVCRIDRALNEQVRTQAARAGQTLTTFVERALATSVAAQPRDRKHR